MAAAKANDDPPHQKTNPDAAQKPLPPGDNDLTAFSVQKNDEATARYRKDAEQGAADAQFALGAMYANGQGVERDYNAAAMWYRKAADQGYAKAQYNLGRMYFNGQGVPYDYLLAVKWLNRAATQDGAAGYNQKEILKRTASFR